jgi:hypothetical protein
MESREAFVATTSVMGGSLKGTGGRLQHTFMFTVAAQLH